MKSIIDLYKRHRKYKLLSSSLKKQYAFIGIGNHSLNNLYPVLDYLHVPLKYIVSENQQTANCLNTTTWHCIPTNDYNIVLNDPSIEGIFISASPNSHYELIKKALENNKNVFVEKPPCQTLEELRHLISIQQKTGNNVQVGLQKRYAPSIALLKKKINNIDHYTFSYTTGAYPEGNAIIELFIHPIDLVVYLFGEAEIKSILRNKETLLIHLLHKNGTAGSLELSTGYSWQEAKEQLTIVTKKDIYELKNLSELLCRNKPITIGNIPAEKILKFIPKTETLFNQNMFLPINQHNNLYINGFYSEIEMFIMACENNNFTSNKSELTSLLNTYRLLESINKS